jgi:signal transduction histidine kinase
VSDGRLLRRVFYNLLDNAIKYTGPAGRVDVAVSGTDGVVTVAVRDTGIGIPTEHLPRVFDRFYRVDSARAGDEAGAGLGLSICHSIVTALGGTITVDSTAGQGTTVRVALPSRPGGVSGHLA